MRQLALVAALLLSLAVPGGAGAADGACSTSAPEIDLPLAPDRRYYVDVDDAVRDVFVYREGNGVEGLQRGDANRDDTDGGRCFAPDTFVALTRLP